MNDMQFLNWIFDRLVRHGDNKNNDYMHRLRAISSAMGDRNTPNAIKPVVQDEKSCHVVINGIEYVPKCDIKEPSNKDIARAIDLIVTTIHLEEKHKAYSRLWNILGYLSLEAYELADSDIKAAFDRFCCEDKK